MSQKYRTPEDEYKINKDLKKEDVIIIQDWMNKQPHLPKISENEIIRFLNACYFKIEAAKTCIDKFYTVRAHWPEFINNRDIFSNGLQQALHMALGTVLPIHTKENYQIIFSKFMNEELSVFNALNSMKLFDIGMLCWYRLLEIQEGDVLVIDMKEITLAHVLKCRSSGVRKYLYYIQEAFPIKLKALHLLNSSPNTDALLSFAKPLMNEGMINLIHTHKNVDTLIEYIPQEALPNEYGGTAGTFADLHEKQIKLIEDNAKFILEDAQKMVDESKRLEKIKNLSNIFGIEGTFKKLDIH